jgi:hypothetical protein
VDDLLILATIEEIEALKLLLIRRFKTLTIKVQENLSYLGMQLVRDNQKTVVDMTHYVDKVVDEAGTVMKRRTPGTRTTFNVDDSSVGVSLNDGENPISCETCKARRINSCELPVYSHNQSNAGR